MCWAITAVIIIQQCKTTILPIVTLKQCQLNDSLSGSILSKYEGT